MLRRLATLCVVNLRARHPERGATAVEYALMVMLIALVVIGAVTGIGTTLTTIFTGASSRV
jgi:pilus assembly protein Flp/PilA